MKLNSLLAIIGSCLCLGASAQTIQKPAFGTSFVNNNASLGGKALERVIQPVETAKGADGVMRAVKPFKKVTTPWKARRAMRAAATDGTLKLDSVIGYNADGSKATLQAFTYRADGLETHRENSYYNAETGAWELAEEYGYEWTDDGLILDEWGKYYGSGLRHTYKYNDRGWGTEMIIYTLGTDGEWVYDSKGEYEYDDNANITAERTYVWDGSQWQPSTKAVSEYDSKNRQTYLEGYTWDGSQWVGGSKAFYEWTDKPNPTPVDGASTDRFTLAQFYAWDGSQWVPNLMYVQEFDNPDGYITMQETCWWNGRNWGGENGSTSVSLWEYDENNVTISNSGYLCVNDSTKWVKSYDTNYNWTYNDDGSRNGTYDIIFYYYDENYENIALQYTEERFEEAYDAAGRMTWRKYWDCNLETYELEESEEEKTQYDGNGNVTYEAHWIWRDGERQPETEITYEYDEDGNVIDQLGRQGGAGGMIPMGAPASRGKDIEPEDLEGWTNSTHFTYAYENGERTEKICYSWRDEQWTPRDGQTVEYDFDYPMDAVVTPVTWTDPYKIDAIHDLSGDGMGGWLSADRLYYWTEHNATGISETVVTDVKVRLNGDILTVTGADGATVNVYNAGGTCMASTNGDTVGMGGMPAGVYIVKVGSYATKIVKK